MRSPGLVLAGSMLLLGAAKPGNAAGFDLVGKVTDSLLAPLAGVSVRLAVAGKGVFTDASGNWQIVDGSAQVLARGSRALRSGSSLLVARGRVSVVVDGRLSDGRRARSAEASSTVSALSRSLAGADDTLVFSKPGYQVLRRAVDSAQTEVDVQLHGAGTPGMVLVPGGTYLMGSAGVTGAVPHHVTLDSFRIDTTEVTRTSYKRLMGTDPSATSPGCLQCPVENVDWYGALRYCDARSLAEGLPVAYDISNGDSTRWTWIAGSTGYRLPTEAEWEYAARGGSQDDWFWGPYIDSATLSQYAWYKVNSGDSTHPVGSLKANKYGLKDVAGNVWEWVWDWYQTPYATGDATNPTGPTDDADMVYKVIRGGGWDSPNTETPQTCRSNVLPYNAWRSIGLRCVSGLH